MSASHERSEPVPPEGEHPQPGAGRRRAGCLWQLLVEPWVIFGLTLAAVLFGRAYLVRRARRLRAASHRDDSPEGNDG